MFRILRYLLPFLCGLLIVACGSSQQIIDELRAERDELKEQLTEANGQILVLREKNASLESDLQGGRPAEEKSKALDVRENGLNQLTQDLQTRKSDLDKREIEIRSRELAVEQKLDEARKETISLANSWLIAILALAILIPASLIGTFIWLRTRNPMAPVYPPAPPLTPRQAYMLETVYSTIDTPKPEVQIPTDANDN